MILVLKLLSKILFLLIFVLFSLNISAQENLSVQNRQAEKTVQVSDQDLRPSINSYLRYLKQELTVTDDPSSRREVSKDYLRHNYNRVSALQTFTLKLVNETETDFIPEMDAVTVREFHLLFYENPPKAIELKPGEIYNLSYRFLGTVKNLETFYIFARLDPYEEEFVRKRARNGKDNTAEPAENIPKKAETVEKNSETKEEISANSSNKNETIVAPTSEKPVKTLTRERFLRDKPLSETTLRNSPPQ